MMTGTKFDIEKFDRKNDFSLWQVKMKALLEHHELAATFEELHAATIVAYDNVIQKKDFYALILCLGDRGPTGDYQGDDCGGDLKKLETLYITRRRARALNSREIQKMMEAKGDGGEGLDVRRTPGQRDMEQGTYSARSKSQGRSSRLRCYICWSDEHLKRDCLRYNHKKSQSCVRIEDHVSGSEADGECRVRGTGKVQVHMKDGSSFLLDNVRYVSEFRRNLISLGTLENEGFTVKMQSGKIKVIKYSLVILSGTRRANCVYTLDDHVVTRKTLKGRKQLGEYQTGNIDFKESGEYKKTFIGSGVGTGSVHVLQEVKFEVEPHEDHTFEVEPHGIFDHVASLQEMIWMLDQMYMCSTTIAGNAVTTSMSITGSIHQDQSGNTLRVSQSRFYNRKLVRSLLEGHSILSLLSLEGSLSRDCDVEKNGKWSCIYAVGSHEYQMVCTRLDISSADVGMLDKFDRGLQTDVQGFVDFDYAIGRSITNGIHDTYRGCKGGYLAKGTHNRGRIRAKDSSGYCYTCLVKGGPRIEVTARVEALAYRRFLI
nr:zinc finger, CCHC-type [Tanacetum cinerariifolium]